MGRSGLRRGPAALACLALLGGCAELGYYAQAIHGHSTLMHAARPVADWLDDPATGPALRTQLLRSQAIRDFASRELGLPDNRSYRSYAALGRRHVVWNVVAAPEFSLQPKTWCLAFAGCVAYRGYFDRQAAEALAGELQASGFDTWVAGVPAYSTLGHFDDPLLDTFLPAGEAEVARLIFHELAHQLIYVPGDSEFNESFASAVENEGLRRWLAAHGTAEQIRADAVRRQRRAAVLERIERCRQQLRRIYAEPTNDDERRAAKRAAFAELQRDYAAMKRGWGGAGDFDAWFAGEPDNARVVALGLYTRLLPAFETLLDAALGRLPEFYRTVAELADLPPEVRRAVLHDLM